jgi:Nucleotide modification associated domain 3
MFGQANAAEGHLKKMEVGPGDLFLFFGWFRHVELTEEKYSYKREDKHGQHCLFGWLQVEKRHSVTTLNGLPEWAWQHPHVKTPPYHPKCDAVYIAGERLDWPGVEIPVLGGGVFPSFSPKLVLTAEGQPRTLWKVPGWLSPNDRSPLSYHGKKDRWVPHGDALHLQTVSRGQEFVLQADEYPEAVNWVADLFRTLVKPI